MMYMDNESNGQFVTLLSTESLKDKDTIQLVKREEPVIFDLAPSDEPGSCFHPEPLESVSLNDSS